MEREPWYSYSIEQVFKKLNSSKNGLKDEEASKRLKEFGYNELEETEKGIWLKILLRQFHSFIIYVLLLATVLSYIIGNHVEAHVIFFIILFIILLGFFEEYKAAKDMDALKSLSPKMARVIRNKEKKEVAVSDIAVGDILIVTRGDIVPADARLVESCELKVDESTLTGESAAVMKTTETITSKADLSKQTNIIFSSSQVTNGDGLAVVFGTGKNTEIGKVSEMIQSIEEQTTPLQKRLNKLGRKLSFATIGLCVLLFFYGTFRGQAWEEMIVLAIALSVSGIPESLPTVVAVTLAVGVKRMAKQNAIIKRLPAVETLGSTSVICTDKTGTLTQNKMVIENIYTLDSEVLVTGEGFLPRGLFLQEDVRINPKKHKTISKLLEIGVLCNNSELVKQENEWKISGESTEGALIVLAKKAGLERASFHKRFPRIKEHPFDPVRKCMSAVHMVKRKKHVYTKGAPELLIKKCRFYLHNGRIKKITPGIIRKVIEKNKQYASHGLRVLGLAYKEHKGKKLHVEAVESELVFVGLVSMRDPPGKAVKESVKLCQDAGIKVVMITGDNEITAKAIALELGIFKPGDLIVTGEELDRLDDAKLDYVVNKITVYARVTPEHKLRIVDALQSKENIVAMTGDGVNDAPALKKADIGISMGRRGTEVAKEASEMILKDDNFTTIVNAVKEGRTIYDNIRKFIYYLLVGNFSEVILVVIAVLLGSNLPLTALMILFINLVTSDLPALGLSVEKSSPRMMRQRPRDPKEGILSNYLFLKIGELVPLLVLGTLFMFMWVLVIRLGTIERAQTMAFVTIIFFELMHVFNARSWVDSIFKKGFFSNKYVNLGVFGSLVGTAIVVYWSPAQSVFGTIPLTAAEVITALILASSVIFFTEIQKTAIASEIKEREKVEIFPTRR